jgi:hypothetical protein
VPAGVNLNDRIYISCSGQFSNCGQTSFGDIAFRADVPKGSPGDVITGSAAFTVAASAMIGETISFSGYHRAIFGGPTPPDIVFTSSPLVLTVTAPQADLGVSLSATSLSPSPQVSYDAAVTNNGPAAGTSATITTQLPSQATGISSSTCSYASSTDRVTCPIGALANGATAHATFTAAYGLLTIGALNATATRTASAPTDPNAANHSDGANCTAITALIITC